MAPANNSNKHNNVSSNHNHLSIPSKPTNMANPNPIPNPNPSIGNGFNDQTLNPPPAHYNRNNSSLRLFNDWLEKAEKNNHKASSSSALPATATTAMEIDGSEEDVALAKSEVLTREEVLRRRSRQMKNLIKVYKEHYWSMTEEIKIRYREYYWEFGKSPFQDDEVAGENVDGNNSVPQEGLNRCEVHGCKVKAMAMTRFCHTHILSDSKQRLYKGCSYVTKSLPSGPIYCMKPVLRSTVPLLCSMHLGKAEKHVAKALRKAGLTTTCKSKFAPKLHVVIAEFVRQLQAKRRRIALVENKKG
ncbi:INO80 complex subunit D-like [Impatiens glandulifera]|uniref:INO80 complex subunit D-like n=1 Tax=Impatiens glandulifera TaxID=253017 RepID=UPI001FB174EA|nr:INO80 complex subunit D-like [Impatiens glandulifera]